MLIFNMYQTKALNLRELCILIFISLGDKVMDYCRAIIKRAINPLLEGRPT